MSRTNFNTWQSNLIKFVLILLLCFSVNVFPAHAATLCVAPGGAGGCYASIQSAVNAAGAGDIITVAAGTYAEAVVIDRSITLQGTSATIQPAAGAAITLRSPNALPPPLINVTISGFTLDGSDGILIDRNMYPGDASLTVHNLTITNVTATGNTANGLTIRNGAIVNGLTISDSHFDGNVQNGIAISNTATQVNDVTITDTTVSSNNQVGIYLFGPIANGMTLTGVTVNNNGYEGIVISNSAVVTNLSINESTISSSGRITASRGIGLGISLTGTQIYGLSIVDSNFTSNRAQGVYFDRATISDISFHDTNITSSTWDGIHIVGSASINDFLISGGSISSNNGFGFISRSGTGGLPTISGLVIDGVQFNGNNNSGLSLIGTLNNTNVIRNNTFYNSAWEDLDIGVNWLGSPTTISGSLTVINNIFQMPGAGRAWTSAYVESGTVGVANINFTQNCFNRTGGAGLTNSSATQVSALYNWWNSADGPGTGRAGVSGSVSFNPWSTSAGSCSVPVVVYDLITNPVQNATLMTGPTQITIEYNKDVKNDGSSGAANNRANYLLAEDGADGIFNTSSCSGNIAGDDVRIPVDSASYANNGGAGPFVATLNINGGVPLPAGVYRLFVCGTTSIQDWADNRLDGGNDMWLNFTVAAAGLPRTGFAPGLVTKLPIQPQDKAYASLGDIWLEIPSQNVKASIVGVPSADKDGWDVTWLGNSVGWLSGTAFPSWTGNSVLTAHAYDFNGQPGPFASIKKLSYDDRVIVHAFGQKYVFALRSNRLLSAKNGAYAFQHLTDESYLTLITCEGYNPLGDSYIFRRVLRLVLVEVTPE